MTEQGFRESEIQTGERIAVSPVTGQRYLVTRWVEHGEGRLTALAKKPIGRGEGHD